MRIARALERADDGQADCYWHDSSTSLQYLIVMQGALGGAATDPEPAGFAEKAGRVTKSSRAYVHATVTKPELLPAESGPVTILITI